MTELSGGKSRKMKWRKILKMKYNQNFPKGNDEEMPSGHSASLLNKGLPPHNFAVNL